MNRGIVFWFVFAAAAAWPQLLSAGDIGDDCNRLRETCLRSKNWYEHQCISGRNPYCRVDVGCKVVCEKAVNVPNSSSPRMPDLNKKYSGPAKDVDQSRWNLNAIKDIPLPDGADGSKKKDDSNPKKYDCSKREVAPDWLGFVGRTPFPDDKCTLENVEKGRRGGEITNKEAIGSFTRFDTIVAGCENDATKKLLEDTHHCDPKLVKPVDLERCRKYDKFFNRYCQGEDLMKNTFYRDCWKYVKTSLEWKANCEQE